MNIAAYGVSAACESITGTFVWMGCFPESGSPGRDELIAADSAAPNVTASESWCF